MPVAAPGWAPALARQAPYWEPGTAHGYHVNTHGFLVGEPIVRRLGMPFGRALRERLTGPHAIDFHSGLPAGELKDDKRAAMRVHGRTGQPCPVCGDTVREVSFADRSLQYCPTCQTGGKPLADRRMSRLLK